MTKHLLVEPQLQGSDDGPPGVRSVGLDGLEPRKTWPQCVRVTLGGLAASLRTSPGGTGVLQGAQGRQGITHGWHTCWPCRGRRWPLWLRFIITLWPPGRVQTEGTRITFAPKTGAVAGRLSPPTGVMLPSYRGGRDCTWPTVQNEGPKEGWGRENGGRGGMHGRVCQGEKGEG